MEDQIIRDKYRFQLMNLNAITIAFISILEIVSYMSAVISINFSQSSFSVIEDQAEENDELREMVERDQMTGLYNHNAFYTQLSSAIDSFNINKIDFCVALLDIDDFKTINDTYGHDCGDQVLITISKVLSNHGEKNNIVCRYGGEEFAIIFCGKNIGQVHNIMENALKFFAAQKYDFTQNKITFSCGIVQYKKAMTKEDVFTAADSLMYEAKQNGKNQIFIE